MPLIALVHSVIAAITLLACVMVGRVLLWWFNCAVSVNCSLRVDATRHRCVR